MRAFEKDALYYAELVKKGEVSVKELVQRALDAIKKGNKEFNAVSVLQEKYALERAEQLDFDFQHLTIQEKENLPPFFGVPTLLKDLGQAQKGCAMTSGAKLNRGYVARESDNFVKKIESAGFVVVGRTNTPEFGFKNISDSRENGPVSTPLDLTRNAGGSSGGAAAALVAGFVPIVTASDGGGSIRIPASFNGLIGLKPSRGRIPVGPDGYRGWQGASVNFALTKSVRDTWELLKWMQIEQLSAPFSLPLIKEKDLILPNKSLRIVVSAQSPVNTVVSEKAREAIAEAKKFLKDLGHEIVEKKLEINGEEAMDAYFMVNGAETAAMFKSMEIAMGRAIKFEDVEPMTWALYQYGQKLSAADVIWALSVFDKVGAQYEEYYKEIDVLVTPSTNEVAPPHGEFALTSDQLEKIAMIEFATVEEAKVLVNEIFHKSLAWTPFTQQQNLGGQPAISLPLYETPTELPLGVQFSSGKGQEARLLGLAMQLESAGELKVRHKLKKTTTDGRLFLSG